MYTWVQKYSHPYCSGFTSVRVWTLLHPSVDCTREITSRNPMQQHTGWNSNKITKSLQFLKDQKGKTKQYEHFEKRFGSKKIIQNYLFSFWFCVWNITAPTIPEGNPTRRQWCILERRLRRRFLSHQCYDMAIVSQQPISVSSLKIEICQDLTLWVLWSSLLTSASRWASSTTENERTIGKKGVA